MDSLVTLDTEIVDEMFYVNGNSHTLQDYLAGVDSVLNQIQDSGDFEIGANTIRSMSSIGHAIGISKAKLLHGMWNLWQDQMQAKTEDSFFEYVADFAGMNNRVVVQRYIQAWDAVLFAPKEHQQEMLAQPMKNLNALGSAIAQGFELSDDQWDKVASTSNNSEFLKVMQNVKGAAPRKSSLTIYLEKNGDLMAIMGNEIISIGYLDVNNLERDETGILRKSIERITKNTGIIRR